MQQTWQQLINENINGELEFGLMGYRNKEQNIW